MLNDRLVRDIQQLIGEVLLFKQPVDRLLSQFFRERKRLENKVRYVVAETVYSLLRNYHKLKLISDKLDDYRIIGLLWSDVLKLEVQDCSNISLENFFQFKDQLTSSNTSLLELPEWVTSMLTPYYSLEEITAIDGGLAVQAELTLRVNTAKTTVENVMQQLAKDEIKASRTKFSPFGIKIHHKVFLVHHQLFSSGGIEVQDEASQLAAMLLTPNRHEMVVDFCAGAGGKTLILGMLMRNSGRIYAFDINQKRLDKFLPRLARSGLSNVYPQLISKENDTKVKRLYGKIDRVLVDAPCSGLGTLRRSPELKFRQNAQTVSELNCKQLSILTAASKLLKVGGRLVYATCSILPAENQQIVAKFLEQNSNFRLVNAAEVLNIPQLSFPDGYLLLLPHLHDTDGFFAALIERVE